MEEEDPALEEEWAHACLESAAVRAQAAPSTLPELLEQQLRNLLKDPNSISSLSWAGVPAAVRGQVWREALQQVSTSFNSNLNLPCHCLLHAQSCKRYHMRTRTRARTHTHAHTHAHAHAHAHTLTSRHSHQHALMRQECAPALGQADLRCVRYAHGSV